MIYVFVEKYLTQTVWYLSGLKGINIESLLNDCGFVPNFKFYQDKQLYISRKV